MSTTTDSERPSVSEIRDLATVSVETAGRFLGLGRSGSFEAARRGDIPTIKIGKRLLVPVPALLRLIGA